MGLLLWAVCKLLAVVLMIVFLHEEMGMLSQLFLFAIIMLQHKTPGCNKVDKRVFYVHFTMV